MPSQLNLAVKIKQIIQKNGGVPKCSQKLKIAENTLRNYSSGISEPTASKLHAIAHLGGVTLDWLVLGEGAMHPSGEAELAQAAGVGAKNDKEFAQRLAEQCHEMLKSTQKRLDETEQLRREAATDLAQANRVIRDLETRLGEERAWRIQLQTPPSSLLNAPSAEPPLPATPPEPPLPATPPVPAKRD